MTNPANDDDLPDETPGGSTISDPEVFNDPEGAGDEDDEHDDELDAPDPA